ncbi:MAG: hypothetical protein SGBAC_006557 [Bacillariaceae sp.]
MEQHDQNQEQQRQEIHPLHLSSDAESLSTYNMPLRGNAYGNAATGDANTGTNRIPTLQQGDGTWNRLPITKSSTKQQHAHEIAFTFRLLIMLASCTFLIFGMVKLFGFSSNHHKRQKRRKKHQDETAITTNGTTIDLEAANPGEDQLEQENLLEKTTAAMPIHTSSKRKSPAKWLTDIGQDWMSYLDDNLNLASISIPGSHDSGSRYGGIYVTTQTWRIDQQLASGIRFLDIRCRREGKVFTIHHGPFYQHLWFDQVLEIVRSFFEAHPSETILMRVKEEYDPKDGSLSFVAIWNRYMNELEYGDLLAQYPWDGKTIPTLGQVRGKIVLLRDFAWNGPEIGLHYNRFGNAFMEVQDDYSLPFVNGISKKKLEVRAFLKKAKERTCQDKIIINHCSGTKPPVYTPSFVAKRTNRVAYDEIGLPVSSIECCYTGIIVMDFAGESLIHRIIQSNATRLSPQKKTPFTTIGDGEFSALAATKS